MAKLIIISLKNNLIMTLSTLLILTPKAYSSYPTNPILTPYYDRSPICKGPQKSSEIEFYTQNIYSGPGQSLYEVANSSITDISPSQFGLVLVFDVKLTRGPDFNSQQVGRAQGIAISADLKVLAYALYINILCTSDECYGSTITILGRFQQVAEYRELSVVGGTGIFRCARGYTIATTYSSDQANVDVFHFKIYLDHVCGV